LNISQAEKQKLELLISKPSDLFQIDTLNLLQFILFLLSQSLGANTVVTQKVNKDLIAVGKDHQYKILGQTELAECTKLGQNFLYEG